VWYPSLANCGFAQIAAVMKRLTICRFSLVAQFVHSTIAQIWTLPGDVLGTVFKTNDSIQELRDCWRFSAFSNLEKAVVVS
jgi:hypothetical protein